MNNKQTRGIISLLSASFLYGFFGIYARIIGSEFDVFTQNWIRNILVIGLSLSLLVLFRQKWKKIRKKDILWIVSWIISDILFVITFFIAFNNLTIGTTLFLLYSGITVTGYIAGSFLLNEKLNATKLIAIIITIVGLLLICGEQIYTTKASFLLLGLMSGIVGGLWFVLPKLISNSYPKLQLIILDALGILVVNFLLSQYNQQAIPPFNFSAAWLGILMYGITQIVADFLVIYGFRLVEAHVGSLILPLEVVFGIVLAYFIFYETLSTFTMVGGILVLTGSIIPNFSRFYITHTN